MSVQKNVCFICLGPAPERCPCGIPFCAQCEGTPHPEAHARMVRGLGAVKNSIAEETDGRTHLLGEADGDMELGGSFEEGALLPLMRAVVTVRGARCLISPWAQENPDALHFLASRVTMDPKVRAKVLEVAGDLDQAAAMISALTLGYDNEGDVSLFLPLAFCNHEMALGVPGHQSGARLMFGEKCGLFQVVSLGFTQRVEGPIRLDYTQGNPERFGVVDEHGLTKTPFTKLAHPLFARLAEAYPKGFAYLLPVLKDIEKAFPDPWSQRSGFAHKLLSLRAERNDLWDPNVYLHKYLEEPLRWWTRAEMDLAMYRSESLRPVRSYIFGAPQKTRAPLFARMEASESRLSFKDFHRSLEDLPEFGRKEARALFAPCRGEFPEIQEALRDAGIPTSGVYSVLWRIHKQEKIAYAKEAKIEVEAWQILLLLGPDERRYHITPVRAYLNPTPPPIRGEIWLLSGLKTQELNGKRVKILGKLGERWKVKVEGGKKCLIKPKNLLHQEQSFWVDNALEIGRHGTFVYR